NHRLHLFLLRDIAAICLRSVTGLSDLTDYRVEPVLTACGERDHGASKSEGFGGSGADATAGAGDQDDFVFDAWTHEEPPKGRHPRPRSVEGGLREEPDSTVSIASDWQGSE